MKLKLTHGQAVSMARSTLTKLAIFCPVKRQRQVEGAQTFRNTKSLRFYVGTISHRSISAFPKSQRFQDPSEQKGQGFSRYRTVKFFYRKNTQRKSSQGQKTRKSKRQGLEHDPVREELEPPSGNHRPSKGRHANGFGKPRHASVFSTHSDTQAVPAFHYIRMFKGIFDTLAYKNLRHFSTRYPKDPAVLKILRRSNLLSP